MLTDKTDLSLITIAVHGLRLKTAFVLELLLDIIQLKHPILILIFHDRFSVMNSLMVLKAS